MLRVFRLGRVHPNQNSRNDLFGGIPEKGFDSGYMEERHRHQNLSLFPFKTGVARW